MNQPRRVRELAMVLLYRIDAEGGAVPSAEDAQDLADTLQEEGSTASDLSALGEKEVVRSIAMAADAYAARAECDANADALAPEWPSHRRPAIDRAILRLAIHEMQRADSEPKAIVNDAIEFAKHYSTDKSPAFVNALLDKVLKRVLAERAAASGTSEAAHDAPAAAEGA
ncbi:MAG: transcription antitermination factor NusB [Phycisphaerales bacterium]|jgi:N utilization substance protein B|nr:transcription antitermination factor NusB [Phycisphaerales bacterium]